MHTDDFASWENPVDWWPVLLEQVLQPLARGERVTFVPNSWAGPSTRPVTIDAGGTPRKLRLERGLARDGEDARPLRERWMAEEEASVARERPAEHADAVIATGE